jgi:hypothetical protein
MLKQVLIILFFSLLTFHTKSSSYTLPKNGKSNTILASIDNIAINKEALRLAINGYTKLKEQGRISNSRYLTIIDFSKPSNTNRFFVIDMQQEALFFQTLVAHGKNSGTLFAKTFSNKDASFKSSLGFYITGNIYNGKHGSSLELEGLEKGINDHAMKRAIVLHGANYVSEYVAKQQGFIGRSLGCPAVPNDHVSTIINAIQGASCLFVYAPNKAYLQKSLMAN